LLAAEIELYLELAILTKLTKNDKDTINILVGRDGPPGSFYAKIHLAYAMGIIDDDVCHDLNIIRNVRNAFAHAPSPIEFYTEEIESEVKNLRCVKGKEFPPIPSRGLAEDPRWPGQDPIRQRFIAACRELGHLILTTVLAAPPQP